MVTTNQEVNPMAKQKSNNRKAKTVATKSSPATIAHHTQMLKAMRSIIGKETFADAMSDRDMAEAVKERGVYASRNSLRDCRLANNIPTAYARKMKLFGKGKK